MTNNDLDKLDELSKQLRIVNNNLGALRSPITSITINDVDHVIQLDSQDGEDLRVFLRDIYLHEAHALEDEIVAITKPIPDPA